MHWENDEKVYMKKRMGKDFFYGEIFCEISWVIFEKKRKKLDKFKKYKEDLASIFY